MFRAKSKRRRLLSGVGGAEFGIGDFRCDAFADRGRVLEAESEVITDEDPAVDRLLECGLKDI